MVNMEMVNLFLEYDGLFSKYKRAEADAFNVAAHFRNRELCQALLLHGANPSGIVLFPVYHFPSPHSHF